jgi:ppGpp synthetase/RelA/SpoT-type nucleotidyltranferase
VPNDQRADAEPRASRRPPAAEEPRVRRPKLRAWSRLPLGWQLGLTTAIIVSLCMGALTLVQQALERRIDWGSWASDLVVLALCILGALLLTNHFLVHRPLRRILGAVRLMRSGYDGRLELVGDAREWQQLAGGIHGLERELEETARRLVEAERQALAETLQAVRARDDSSAGLGTVRTPSARPSAPMGAQRPAAPTLRHKLMTLYWQDKCRVLESQDSRDPVVQSYAREVWEQDVHEAERVHEMALRARLDDAAFRVLHPEEHAKLTRYLQDMKAKHAWQLGEHEAELQEALEQDQVPIVAIEWRVKHAAGIFRKMQANAVDLDQVKDVFAYRIIVPERAHCYQALAAVHQRFEPHPLRFRDYIANPKPNGYQSLHSYVRAEGGLSFEIQIRSEQMHQRADGGSAAHWRYKSDQQAVARPSRGASRGLGRLWSLLRPRPPAPPG